MKLELPLAFVLLAIGGALWIFSQQPTATSPSPTKTTKLAANHNLGSDSINAANDDLPHFTQLPALATGDPTFQRLASIGAQGFDSNQDLSLIHI